MVGYTLTPEVVAELRRRAAAAGEKVSRVADAALRAGLGLPPEPFEARVLGPTSDA